MKNSPIYKQAELLLKILPIVNRESVFALKGGTAINFFVRDLPRLSVDIDLAYLPVKKRLDSLKEISQSLHKIEENILRLIPGIRSQKKIVENNIIGLIINTENANVKIEPNTTIRGTVYETTEYNLCNKGKELFEASVKIRSLAIEELYAGKICAALDRQHPRDLYDVKLLFENEGITEKIRKAFLVYLISHNRPILELLNPNFSDISKIYEQEFIGMTIDDCNLEDLIKTRKKLVTQLNTDLTNGEKRFLLSFKSCKPDWNLIGLNNIRELPAVKWKLMNLEKMDKEKHATALSKLNMFLFS